MWFRKRMLAGILAAVVAVSSVQLPASVVYAEETVEGNISDVVSETADQTGGRIEEEGQDKGETEETEETEEAGSGGESVKPEDDGGGLSEDGSSETETTEDGSSESETTEDGGSESGTTDEDTDVPGKAEDGSDQSADPEETDDKGSDSEVTEPLGDEEGGTEDSAGETEEPEEEQQISGNDIPESGTAEGASEEGGGRGILATTGEALDLANPSAEYTALDGSKISSAAQGQPKLLIFYSNTCYNSQTTIRGISQKVRAFAGVDIYGIETSNKTKETIIQYFV